jgi:hypothetical protein
LIGVTAVERRRALDLLADERVVQRVAARAEQVDNIASVHVEHELHAPQRRAAVALRERRVVTRRVEMPQPPAHWALHQRLARTVAALAELEAHARGIHAQQARALGPVHEVHALDGTAGLIE